MIRPARPADLAALHPIIERAYRSDAGWTHEAGLVPGERIAQPALAAILDQPGEQLLVAERDGAVAGCVQISMRADLATLGLLAVDPARQAGGIGRQLIAAAERHAAAGGARAIEMTVIDSRRDLIAYYARRGYADTGERRPFAFPLDPPLRFAVLAKDLSSSPRA